MKVLWLCNIVLPAAARQLGLEVSNKEGWVSGMADMVLTGSKKISLSIAAPLPRDRIPQGQEIYSGTVWMGESSFSFYGFGEDVNHAEKYDENLEPALKKIVSIEEPDIVHCFGTEYPHTLAMCRIFPRKDRLLLGIQGLCAIYAECYYADLPGEVIRQVTLRDWLKQDSLRRQQEKFVLRGRMEREAVELAGNITGRTHWDRKHTKAWNPQARYHEMNESLRAEFYGPIWEEERCEPYTIFLSQGDYPIKGLHYMLLALPAILEAYPETKVYVAGNSLVAYGTWKQKLKISAYGKYLRSLLKGHGLEERVNFLGKLDAEQMRDRYLKSSLFVCCSSVENSPNSLGEAMLLGVPCVSADVGGITSIFTGGVDGILYKGFSGDKDGGRGGRTDSAGKPADGFAAADAGAAGSAAARPAVASENELEAISGRLAEAVIRMWQDPAKRKEYCRNARAHALRTHDREQNYRKLVEIYEKIL